MARSREWAMFRPIDPTPNQVGICGQLEEEQSHTSPAGGILYWTLSGTSRWSIWGFCSASGSLQTATGGNGDGFDHHADSGSHGGCLPRGTAGVTAYASPAEVVCRPSFRSQEAQTTSGNHPPLSGGQPPILGVPKASAEGNSTGAGDLLHHGVHRCIRDRMGGTCLERAIGGGWPLTETRHINLLELQAVVLVLQHCKPLLQGKHVLVMSDNRTTEAYINRQDGVSSAALFSAAENLWLGSTTACYEVVGIPKVV